MKLTMSKLKEMVLKEISGTKGTARDAKKVQSTQKAADVATRAAKGAEAAYDVGATKAKKASDALKDANADVKTAQSELTKWDTLKPRVGGKKTPAPGVAALASAKYYTQNKKGQKLYAPGNKTKPPVGFGPWQIDAEWASWDLQNTQKTNILTNRQTVATSALTKSRAAETASRELKSELDDRVKEMNEKERQAKAAKKQTGFGFGAGAGGRSGGKGYMGKRWGKGDKGGGKAQIQKW